LLKLHRRESTRHFTRKKTMKHMKSIVAALLFSAGAVACAGAADPETGVSEQAATTRANDVVAAEPSNPSLFCTLCRAQGCQCNASKNRCVACGLTTAVPTYDEVAFEAIAPATREEMARLTAANGRGTQALSCGTGSSVTVLGAVGCSFGGTICYVNVGTDGSLSGGCDPCSGSACTPWRK